MQCVFKSSIKWSIATISHSHDYSTFLTGKTNCKQHFPLQVLLSSAIGDQIALNGENKIMISSVIVLTIVKEVESHLLKRKLYYYRFPPTKLEGIFKVDFVILHIGEWCIFSRHLLYMTVWMYLMIWCYRGVTIGMFWQKKFGYREVRWMRVFSTIH